MLNSDLSLLEFAVTLQRWFQFKLPTSVFSEFLKQTVQNKSILCNKAYDYNISYILPLKQDFKMKHW